MKNKTTFNMNLTELVIALLFFAVLCFGVCNKENARRGQLEPASIVTHEK